MGFFQEHNSAYTFSITNFDIGLHFMTAFAILFGVSCTRAFPIALYSDGNCLLNVLLGYSTDTFTFADFTGETGVGNNVLLIVGKTFNGIGLEMFG